MAASIETLKPEIGPSSIVTTPEDVAVSETSRDEGVEQIPSTPQPLQVQTGDDQTVQVTPVPAPAAPQGPAITIPASQTQLTQMAQKGNTTNASTGWAVFWLRQLKKALKKHWSVLVGGGNPGENV